ncbi:MAG: UvrD-helicase domain-containing protein [Thiocapsa sp.]|uniref:3'-5' exonuclease n=1 Tax=Thiocapsa sp. TaxID=2024551 RepID=UPI001BCE2FC4|nr:3'-5' exonuclease [Thiocapsa sp.]QVL46998.1 MAG: UvrD-helicase domain-containing protein [Thiocapsa sp.]
MDFRIADTFTDSLARLAGDEQKAVKTTAFDLQINPANPGLAFHKLDKARDKNFWSVRVGSDIRLIVHRASGSLLLCYVDHHDRAYAWAERRKLEVHPQTGAAQLVEIRERIEEVAVPVYVKVAQPTPTRPLLFAQRSDSELLGYGVPPEWLADVRLANEDTLLELADHLPAEAAEALLQLATGEQPPVSRPVATPDADPFAHPDAQRRFRIMSDAQELERALAFPWDKWTIFLHPAQRQWVEREFNGPARVCGSAGTGKTIVALHRAVFLARRHPESRVLLTTLSETLANALRTQLRRLISTEPRLAERLEVDAINAVGSRLYARHLGPARMATDEQVTRLIAEASAAAGNQTFGLGFLRSEWTDLVDAWQLETWDDYRDVKRLGRKTRLPESRRAALWTIFESVRAALTESGVITRAAMLTDLATQLGERRQQPFDFVVVDEAQDLSVPQLRFLAALAAGRPSGLFFAGDLGQRILQPPFSWLSLGVDIRGRARTLQINYRTSHQIRSQADRLLGPETADVDGNTEDRRGTISVFNGPAPTVVSFQTPAEEAGAVAAWITQRIGESVEPHEIAIFVRSESELERARAAATETGLPAKILDEHVETDQGHLSIATMHLAKGLEFRAVAVMACDDEVIPSQSRIETVTDDSDLAEVYNTERHLLYVACTRARDHLFVSGVAPASEFLDDLLIPPRG